MGKRSEQTPHKIGYTMANKYMKSYSISLVIREIKIKSLQEWLKSKQLTIQRISENVK